MNEFNLNSISPIDGRYSDKTEVLSQYFSEKFVLQPTSEHDEAHEDG